MQSLYVFVSEPNDNKKEETNMKDKSQVCSVYPAVVETAGASN